MPLILLAALAASGRALAAPAPAPDKESGEPAVICGVPSRPGFEVVVDDILEVCTRLNRAIAENNPDTYGFARSLLQHQVKVLEAWPVTDKTSREDRSTLMEYVLELDAKTHTAWRRASARGDVQKITESAVRPEDPITKAKGRPDGDAGPASPAKIAEAEKQVNVVLPNDPDVRTDLAKAYLGAGQPSDAERNASKAIEFAPMAPDGWSLRSAARMQQGNYSGAYTDAQQALVLDPQNKLAQTVQSYVKESSKNLRGQKPPDLRALLTTINVPGGARQPSDSGKTATGAGLSDGASSAQLLRGGSVRPAADTPSQRLVIESSTKLKLNDKTGALMAATRAIESDPKNPDAWAARAEVSNKLGNYSAAVKDADQALALDPRDAKALRERSFANYNLGNYQRAYEDADNSVKLEPQNALGYLYRAMAREKLGDIPGALKDYQTAASIDPSLKPFFDDAMARRGGGPTLARLGSRARSLGILAVASVLGLSLIAFALRKDTRGAKTAARWLSGFGAYRGTVSAPAKARSGTLPPGTILGGAFKIAGELGRGGMGIVYDAMDTKLDRRVAVKQLRRELAAPDDLDRFLREAKLAAKLKHPNIVSMLTVVDRDGEAFLVFEYVDGQTLDKRLEKTEKFSLKEARPILSDVCSALGYAHAHRIIHRDLKPSNILVDSGGRARVMDFGIAHQARTVSKETTTAPYGTPAYMAPEQAMGRVSPSSDLYALGVTSYELLTGRLPFGANADDKLNRIFASPSKFGLPPAADAFFDQALEPDPSRRFASAAEFLKRLEELG
jgi:tetratricopeptide (TPR) repeat protein